MINVTDLCYPSAYREFSIAVAIRDFTVSSFGS